MTTDNRESQQNNELLNGALRVRKSLEVAFMFARFQPNVEAGNRIVEDFGDMNRMPRTAREIDSDLQVKLSGMVRSGTADWSSINEAPYSSYIALEYLVSNPSMDPAVMQNAVRIKTEMERKMRELAAGKKENEARMEVINRMSKMEISVFGIIDSKDKELIDKARKRGLLSYVPSEMNGVFGSVTRQFDEASKSGDMKHTDLLSISSEWPISYAVMLGEVRRQGEVWCRDEKDIQKKVDTYPSSRKFGSVLKLIRE